MSMPSHQPPDVVSEDPHGEHVHDHGHTIVDWKILVGVLAVLLTFTVLTVSASQAERWIASAFDVVLPNWVNVAVAMSIATIKGVLVMMYFMQLRYDNLFNTVIMLFCFLAFGLFLGFTSGDLGSRAWIDSWKMAQTSPGGLGLNGTPLVWQARVNVADRRYYLLTGRNRRGEPLENPEAVVAEWKRELGEARYQAELDELGRLRDRAGIEAYIAEHGLEHYFHRIDYYDPRPGGYHAPHADPAHTGSSPERSRPRHGLSGALDAEGAHDDHGHAGDHGPGHDAAEHAAQEEEHGERHETDAERRDPPGLREGDPGTIQPCPSANEPQNSPAHQPGSPPAGAEPGHSQPANPPH
jgi:cytochrome c oxidase subunit 4